MAEHRCSAYASFHSVFYMYMNVLSAYVYMNYVCAWLPTDVRRGFWIPRNWSFRQLWTAVWVLGTIPRLSAREPSVFNLSLRTDHNTPNWAFVDVALLYLVVFSPVADISPPLFQNLFLKLRLWTSPGAGLYSRLISCCHDNTYEWRFISPHNSRTHCYWKLVAGELEAAALHITVRSSIRECMCMCVCMYVCVSACVCGVCVGGGVGWVWVWVHLNTAGCLHP